MKKQLTWKSELLLFVIFEVIAHLIPANNTSPIFEIGTAFAAVLEIAAAILLILGFIGMIKAGVRKLHK